MSKIYKILGVGIIGLVLGVTGAQAGDMSYAEFQLVARELRDEMDAKLVRCREVEVNVPCLRNCPYRSISEMQYRLVEMKDEVRLFESFLDACIDKGGMRANYEVCNAWLKGPYGRFLEAYREFVDFLGKAYNVAGEEILNAPARLLGTDHFMDVTGRYNEAAKKALPLIKSEDEASIRGCLIK